MKSGMLLIIRIWRSVSYAWMEKIYSFNTRFKDFLNRFCIERNIGINYIMKTNATVLNDFELVRNSRFFPYIYISIHVKEARTPRIWNNMMFNVDHYVTNFFNTKENVYFFLIGCFRYVVDLVDENGIKSIEWIW